MKRRFVKTTACMLAANLLLIGCGKNNNADEEVVPIDWEEVEDIDVEPEEIPMIDDPMEEEWYPEEEEFEDTAWNRWVRDDNKEACKEVSFSPATSEMVTVGNKVTSITTTDEDGNTIHVNCTGVSISEDGKFFVLQSGAKMTVMDALGGIKYVDMTCEEDEESSICLEMLYAITGKTSVEKEEQLTLGQPAYFAITETLEASFRMLPNYLRIKVDEPSQAKIESIHLYYTGEYTEIKSFYLNPYFYTYYMPGEKYNPAYERFDPEQNIWDFYVNAKVDSPYIEEYEIGDDIYAIENIKPGNLHSADGSIKSKDSIVEEGDYLDFTFDGMTFNLDSIYAQTVPYQNYHETMPYGNMEATGDLHVLVLPVLFADQEWTKEDEAELKAALGRVVEKDGSVKEYDSFPGEESLSSYFDQASYGNFHIDAYIAEPYEFARDWGEDYTFAVGRDNLFSGYLLDCFADCLNEQLDDPSQYDRDGNGLYDAVYVVNPGDMTGYTSYYSVTLGGALEYRAHDGLEGVRWDGTMGLNYIAYCPMGFLHDGNIRGKEDYDTSTFIHEFSHALGVSDYYDTTYKGVSPLGGFDMQDDSHGDWNAFSKYAVGWIKPTVVLPSEIDEKGSVEITLDAYATTGSCLVIPTSLSEKEEIAQTPFAEYIMVDLFTDEGLYQREADRYGLSGISGVRMYHVDARYLSRNGIYIGEPYTFATPYRSNQYQPQGKYLITLLQAGGTPSLINPSNKDMDISSGDLFAEGSSFSLSKYKAYFINEKMNDLSEFPYTITVKSIENGKAIIEISKQ
ncbi:MAG: hypothetical protein MJ105_04785 [Lachnospiraceae bacterium]|nr:hypothetical protein [Lachnospiraceae bacterium]